MNSKKMIMAAAAAGLLALLGVATIHAQEGGFRFFGPLGRVITPNGDGINDYLFLCFDNFSDSGVTGRIYTLLGAEVASMGARVDRVPGGAGSACPGGDKPQFVSWDARTGQGIVRSGVYVFRIEAEGKTYTGSFLVVR